MVTHERTTVTLEVRLPADIAEQAEELQRSDPELLDRIVLYGLMGRSTYRHLRTSDFEVIQGSATASRRTRVARAQDEPTADGTRAAVSVALAHGLYFLTGFILGGSAGALIMGMVASGSLRERVGRAFRAGENRERLRQAGVIRLHTGEDG